MNLQEEFSNEGTEITRTIRAGAISVGSTIADASGLDSSDLSHRWWKSVLRGQRISTGPSTGEIRTLDLFSGSGGLSVGAHQAIEAIGSSPVSVGALDLDEAALKIHRQNFSTRLTLTANLADTVDHHILGEGDIARFAYTPEMLHSDLASLAGGIDLLLAGPPCQGHSNLNNHTRRNDSRNLLYLDTVAVGIALKIPMMVIENVPAVVHDKFQVVRAADTLLRQAGYTVSHAVLRGQDLPVGQLRKRHFLVATKGYHAPVKEVGLSLKRPPLTLRDTIADLSDSYNSTWIDETPELSADNVRRIAYMLENNVYELPNHERPLCHQESHTYPSVYGRLHWDQPAPTITTGFLTPGRGRFVHPDQPRVLTPHEAARIQGFPDTFDFSLDGSAAPRKLMAKWIGDAVPSVLGYVACLSALSSRLLPSL